jgi:hypothetical protein
VAANQHFFLSSLHRIHICVQKAATGLTEKRQGWTREFQVKKVLFYILKRQTERRRRDRERKNVELSIDPTMASFCQGVPYERVSQRVVPRGKTHLISPLISVYLRRRTNTHPTLTLISEITKKHIFKLDQN